jgi:hypothetical protein
MTSIMDLQLKIKSQYMIVNLISISLWIFVLSVGKINKKKETMAYFACYLIIVNPLCYDNRDMFSGN